MEQQRRNYHNHCIKANKLVRDVRLSVIQDVYHAAHEKHNIVRNLTLDQVKDFAKTLKSQLYIQGLIQGNMTKDQAVTVDTMVRTKLQFSALSGDSKTEIRCADIPTGVNTIRLDSLHEGDANTMVVNYYQSGPGNIRDQAVMEAIVLMMEEPVFDTLRTQEQLGYAVNMVMRNTYGVLGLTVTVNTQATKFTPQHVDERIETFFKDFVKDSFTEETATKAIQSLIKLKVLN